MHYESNIEEDLKLFNLTTNDIDYVLMSHLHFDHASGLTDSEGHAVLKMRFMLFNKMNGMSLLAQIYEVNQLIGRKIMVISPINYCCLKKKLKSSKGLICIILVAIVTVTLLLQ